MGTWAISGVVFVCAFGGALLGMLLSRSLPEHHLSADSKKTIKLGMGLIATMTALVLGLLIASAKSSYDRLNNELTEVSAKVVVLDRTLALYGPESGKARASLRAAVVRVLNEAWTAERPAHFRVEAAEGDGMPARSENLYAQVHALSPQSEYQRALQAQALGILAEIGYTRWLMIEQERNPMPRPFLVVVIFWLVVMFLGFGLVAPRNLTVMVTLCLCALSVAAALFLILELHRPFEGILRISSDPLRYALAQLGR